MPKMNQNTPGPAEDLMRAPDLLVTMAGLFLRTGREEEGDEGRGPNYIQLYFTIVCGSTT